MPKRWLNSKWLGGSLLLIALGIGLATLFWGTFVDEGDNLAVGMMLSRGSVLYRDVFSHHFPFAYYWMAVVTALFGPSIAAARVSILLFEIGSFAWVMYVTRYFTPIGVLCILWNIAGLFFFSNLVLYTGFTGVALTAAFIVAVAILSKRIVAGQKELLTVGIFATVAVLSDPLAIYPILCLLIFLALSPARIKGSLLVGAPIVIGLSLYSIYLLISGSLEAFYLDVIRFNAEVYSKYTFLSPFRLTNLLNLAGSALNLNGPAWQVDPLMLLGRDQLNRWLFTGFLFRLTPLVAALILVLRRRFVLAGFVYLYAVTLLAMNQDTFRIAPSALTAGFVGMWLVFENLDDATTSRPSLQEGRIMGKMKWLVLRFLPWSARCLIAFGFAWLLLRSARAVFQNQQLFSYESNFAYYEDVVNHIHNDLACGQTDVSLIYYPGEPTFNYMAGMPLASKYPYLWPWVAEVGLQETIQGLDSGKTIVNVDWLSLLWGRYRAADYLAPLKTYLENNYYLAGQGFYVSPELASQCHFTRLYPQDLLLTQIPEGEIIPGRKYTQTFTSECAGLSFFDIYPATYGRVLTSTLNVRFRDLDADQQLFDKAIQGSDIVNNYWRRVTFDRLPDSKGKRYRISLASADAEPGNALGIWRTATDVYTGGEAALNGQSLQSDLVFRYGCQP